MKVLMGAFIVVVLSACSASPQTSAPAANTGDEQVVLIAQGRALFRDKGCVTCHINARAEDGAAPIYIGFRAPNLTEYTNDAEFLRRWLSDPAAVRPDTEMPNLHLSDTEIEKLIAFLNEPR